MRAWVSSGSAHNNEKKDPQRHAIVPGVPEHVAAADSFSNQE